MDAKDPPTETILISLKDASAWASDYLDREITVSNISYLVQYGLIERVIQNGSVYIRQDDLRQYYDAYHQSRREKWAEQLGDDLNWGLSFDHLRESDTTKHVHRLHPYKGKFIPQLVAYFLDTHTDDFKTDVFFKPGDIVLDPFCGSGTTLVQANELGIHAIGVDISEFNALIANCKIQKYDLVEIQRTISRITQRFKEFIFETGIEIFEDQLQQELAAYNQVHFPSPDYRYKVRRGEINGDAYGADKAAIFLETYHRLLAFYDIDLEQEENEGFLDIWYTKTIRQEVEFLLAEINQVADQQIRNILLVVLSRTARSCRATTHYDLATLKKPMFTTYYCPKHGKICKPLFSSFRWWKRYTNDLMKRLVEFGQSRTETMQICLTGDSRTIDICQVLQEDHAQFYETIKGGQINGIFSSPPYVGLIDYHEQHAYAYELLGLERRDELEIGPLFKGQGQEARESYIQGIADVLINAKQFLADDYNIFLVANDKYSMYPEIAKRAGMQIIRQYKRPVLNRTERDKGAYSESIFHLIEK